MQEKEDDDEEADLTAISSVSNSLAAVEGEGDEGMLRPIAIPDTVVKRVECDISPFFCLLQPPHRSYSSYIDTGATSSIISRSFLLSAGISPKSTSHTTHGADKSKLKVSGEIHIEGLTFRGMPLTLSALVMI